LANLNFKIDIDGELAKIVLPRNKRISREQIINSIKATLFEEEIKLRLIKTVNSYPDAALPQFIGQKYNILSAILKTRDSLIESEIFKNEVEDKAQTKPRK